MLFLTTFVIGWMSFAGATNEVSNNLTTAPQTGRSLGHLYVVPTNENPSDGPVKLLVGCQPAAATAAAVKACSLEERSSANDFSEPRPTTPRNEAEAEFGTWAPILPDTTETSPETTEPGSGGCSSRIRTRIVLVFGTGFGSAEYFCRFEFHNSSSSTGDCGDWDENNPCHAGRASWVWDSESLSLEDESFGRAAYLASADKAEGRHEVSAIVGGSLNLTCWTNFPVHPGGCAWILDPSSTPASRVVYPDRDAPEASSGVSVVQLAGGWVCRLRVENVTEAHDGRWSCSASSAATNAVQSETVRVVVVTPRTPRPAADRGSSHAADGLLTINTPDQFVNVCRNEFALLISEKNASRCLYEVATGANLTFECSRRPSSPAKHGEEDEESGAGEDPPPVWSFRKKSGTEYTDVSSFRPPIGANGTRVSATVNIEQASYEQHAGYYCCASGPEAACFLFEMFDFTPSFNSNPVQINDESVLAEVQFPKNDSSSSSSAAEGDGDGGKNNGMTLETEAGIILGGLVVVITLIFVVFAVCNYCNKDDGNFCTPIGDDAASYGSQDSVGQFRKFEELLAKLERVEGHELVEICVDEEAERKFPPAGLETKDLNDGGRKKTKRKTSSSSSSSSSDTRKKSAPIAIIAATVKKTSTKAARDRRRHQPRRSLSTVTEATETKEQQESVGRDDDDDDGGGDSSSTMSDENRRKSSAGEDSIREDVAGKDVGGRAEFEDVSLDDM